MSFASSSSTPTSANSKPRGKPGTSTCRGSTFPTPLSKPPGSPCRALKSCWIYGCTCHEKTFTSHITLVRILVCICPAKPNQNRRAFHGRRRNRRHHAHRRAASHRGLEHAGDRRQPRRRGRGGGLEMGRRA